MKKRIFLVISIVFIIAVIITAIIYYYGYYAKPEQTYLRLMHNTLDTKKIIKKSKYNTYEYKANLNIDFTENTRKVNKDLLNIINVSNFDIDTKVNKKNSQVISNLVTNHNNSDILNITACTNIDKKETYIYLKDMLNKYIKIDVNDKLYTFLNKIINAEENDIQTKLGLFNNKIKSIINTSSCYSNKTNKVTKDTMKFKASDFIEALEILDSDIKNNMNLDKYNEYEIEISIYTTGLAKRKIEKVEIIILNKEELIKLYIEDNKTNEKQNKYDKSLRLLLETENIGKVTLNLNYDVKYDTKIEFLDTSNNTSINGLTKDEQIIILDNFKKSNLYNIIKDSITE